MSNLGRYQELVTEAKSLGGVENYLNLIEANAVANAAPRLVARGAVVTVAAFGGFAVVAFEIKRRVDARSALAVAAGAARNSLSSVPSCDNAVDEREQTTTGTGDRACGWCGGSVTAGGPAARPSTSSPAAPVASRARQAQLPSHGSGVT